MTRRRGRKEWTFDELRKRVDTPEKLARAADKSQSLSKKIYQLLAGQPPHVQSMILADLLSIFLAGHNPEIREVVLATMIDLVRQLIPETEKQLFPNGLPSAWSSHDDDADDSPDGRQKH